MKRASAALGNCLSSYAASFLSRRVKARRGGACRAFFFHMYFHMYDCHTLGNL